MTFTTMLEESARHAAYAVGSLANANLWLRRMQQWPKSHPNRRACALAARACLKRAHTYAEIASLALIAHRMESKP